MTLYESYDEEWVDAVTRRRHQKEQESEPRPRPLADMDLVYLCWKCHGDICHRTSSPPAIRSCGVNTTTLQS